jgi:hypothetical protein
MLTRTALTRLMTCALLCATGAALAQQDLPPGMKMHRLQAGTLDQSGWVRAESTQGAFSVKLPCVFNDFLMDDDKAEVFRAHAVGCKRPDGEKYSVTRLEYRGGAAAAKKFFEEWRDESVPANVSKTKSVFNGLPAVDVVRSEPSRCGALRFLLVGPDTILMVAEAPAEQCTHLLSQVPAFLSSLVVKRP